ncbi:response regulator [Paenibacillus sp. sgz302251]|uniref:response regulator n=1 Tax=Paenibacillus sp. sgz302251 TaxID=3414493 RepID=UPI003C7AAF2B
MLRDMRLTIRTKISIGYFLILCCLGVSILIVSGRIASLQNEIETITSRDIEIHNLITTIRYNAISMETSQRGYIITGDETYLEPYYSGKDDWESNYNTLYAFISDNPDTRRDLEEIKHTIENWIETAGEPSIALRRDNRTQEIIDFFNEDSGKQDIDKLRVNFEALHQNQIQETKNYILKLENRNDMLIISLYAMLLLLSIVAFAIITFVSGSIVKTINQVVGTIKNIASSGGDLSTRIDVKSRDEIKELAEATNALLDNVHRQNWIQTKIADVATSNQGINDITTLAQSFLSSVAPMLNATYGIFYIRKGAGRQERLIKLSAYAGSGEEDGVPSFRLGEGLVGQAALDNRAFLLNSTPDHPIRMRSGLGEALPHSILVVPVAFEGKVIAVVEFASLEPFTSQHMKLMEQIEESLGVAINNVAGRMEVERLLSESQVLTEELQAQTEELQAQSEELQMQQEEMRMTTEHLEEQYLYAALKTKELEKAKAELELYSERLKQSSQYKSNFLANMSHELRTPLNSILILSQILSENENETLTLEETNYAKVIHTSGNDLLALIDDILDLTKVEAGKVLLVMDEVNVTEIPDYMTLSFNSAAEKKGIAFLVDVDDDVPSVLYTDGQRLQQILKNLLSNAFKFTETGSVTLKIKNADPQLIEAYVPEHNNEPVLAISVIDTGIGIPHSKQELIFEAFQQVDGETNRQYGGTGLGLSICNEFTRLLGGRIVLESEEQKGSTFTLYIPSRPHMEKEQYVSLNEEVAAASVAASTADVASDAIEQPISQSEDSELSVFKGKKLLLVEDDSRNVFALVKALKSKDFIVTVANNGKHCLEIVQQQSDFDLVLMDIMMPIMDGFETMKILRQDQRMLDTPIIALTAKAMKSDREKCLEAGASDYISKPLDMDQLFSLMRVWLTKQVKH